MTQLPGFSNIPPKPLSKEEVTSTLQSGVQFWTNNDAGVEYYLYPYDDSILLGVDPRNDSWNLWSIIIFKKEHYSILDLTIPFTIDSDDIIHICSIQLDSKLTKDIYIEKLILNASNFGNDPSHMMFNISTNVHISVLEITSPLSLFRRSQSFPSIQFSKMIIPNCHPGFCYISFNEEKDSFELFIDDTKQTPVSIKNPYLGGIHYFSYQNQYYRIIHPYYPSDNINMDIEVDIGDLRISNLFGLYIQDDFVAIDSNGDQIPINSVSIVSSYNISLPNFITELSTDSNICGYLDISRCTEFHLDTLFSHTEPEVHSIYYYFATIYVNSDQFSVLQSSGQIVQRDGEDFWVLASTQEQTSRQNYAKVVIRE